MKVVILCGGLGSRLAEETKIIPKPMVRIGRKPILQYIIEYFQAFGLYEFILATGYKHKIIEKYYSQNKKVNCVFTGKTTMTGGRLLRLKNYFNKNENFLLTYGDGLTNQNLNDLIKFHLKHKKIATLTSVLQPARFGVLRLKNNNVTSFKEKPQLKNNWINGGYFIFNYKIFNFIKNNNEMLERAPFKKLVKTKNLMAFKHSGFWQCMDTMRDKQALEEMLKANKTPWIIKRK